MMEQRQSPAVYPAALTDLLAVSAYQQNDRLIADGDKFGGCETTDRSSTSPASTIEDGDSSQSAFGVDLTGKGTNLSGKSFTIAAILGLTNTEEDVMNLTVQERLQQNQRHLQSYLYSGHEIQRLNDGFCRSMGVPTALRQASLYGLKMRAMVLKIATTFSELLGHTEEVSSKYILLSNSPRPEMRPQVAQMKNGRTHSLSCSNSSAGRSKRIRTIFTPEQLERLEAEFERQQYMVGPERLYLAHALQLTEAQVKVWFQNRRIKWRKHHLEVTQQRLAVLQRHRPDDRDDV